MGSGSRSGQSKELSSSRLKPSDSLSLYNSITDFFKPSTWFQCSSNGSILISPSHDPILILISIFWHLRMKVKLSFHNKNKRQSIHRILIAAFTCFYLNVDKTRRRELFMRVVYLFVHPSRLFDNRWSRRQESDVAAIHCIMELQRQCFPIPC